MRLFDFDYGRPPLDYAELSDQLRSFFEAVHSVHSEWSSIEKDLVS